MYTVTFKGFHTKEQAQAFAEWYSGSGEQDASIWMEVNSDVTSCNAKNIRNIPGENQVEVILAVVVRDE